MSEDKSELTVVMPAEMKRRIDNEANKKDYSGMSDYVRSMVRAGESNVADLDPRTKSSEEGSFDIESKILNGLNDEFQEVDDALDNAVSSLATRLHHMAEDDSYPVEHDPRDGYRLDEE
jgi:Arc/MetJ-type ribon-helix-helix transcriptional regulator